MKRNFKDGFSLIEVIIAMTIIVGTAMALVSTTIFTQKTSRSANAQTQATKLSEENVEQMRVLRDRKGFDSLTDGNCLTLDSSSTEFSNWSLAGCTTGENLTLGDIVFTRKIAICSTMSASCSGGANKKQVTVTVSWQEPGGTRSVSTVTYFSRSLSGS